MVDYADGEPPTEPDSNWVPLRRFDPSKLKLRFTEPRWTCHACRDTGFVQAGLAGNYKPCGCCVRGNKVFTGWWAEAREWRDNRPAQPDANQLLPPTNEEEVQF